MIFLGETFLGSDSATISFTGITGAYRHLLLMFDGRSTELINSNYIYLRFNGDTGTNYDFQQGTHVSGTNAAAGATGQTGIRLGEIPGASAGSTFQSGQIKFTVTNYGATGFFKNVISDAYDNWGTASNTQDRGVWGGRWRNATTGITLIDLSPSANNFRAGTIASLYALK